jgi:riboflavin kinase/FMN adenylyltransferase
MKLIDRIDRLDPADFKPGSYCAIGVFDGMHLAHQAIVRGLVADAREHHGVAVVFTFLNHPLETLAPPYAPLMLLPPERKVELAAELGIDVLFLVEFDANFAARPYDSFLQDILLRQCSLHKLHCGFNFHFGRKGAGGIKELERFAEGGEFALQIHPAVRRHEQVVSSSAIRELLDQGRVADARAMLTRPHELTGMVVAGKQRGRALGFPTANLKVDERRQAPGSGVYAVVARLEGEGEWLCGMMNIGSNPTFDEEQGRLEVHLFNFQGDLYDRRLTVLFLERLRDVKRFSTPYNLIAQLDADEHQARRIAALHLSLRQKPKAQD